MRRCQSDWKHTDLLHNTPGRQESGREDQEVLLFGQVGLEHHGQLVSEEAR